VEREKKDHIYQQIRTMDETMYTLHIKGQKTREEKELARVAGAAVRCSFYFVIFLLV